MEFWNIQNLMKKNAKYNIAYGIRSNGKTYGFLEMGILRYCGYKGKWKFGGKTEKIDCSKYKGQQTGYIRRWGEDLVKSKAEVLFSSIVENGVVEKATGGEWSLVVYKSQKWFFARYIYDEEGERTNKLEVSPEPFCYAFIVTASEHYKSTSYPRITWIGYDEFITRVELPNEFVLFENLLSTIIRNRVEDISIWLLGNTVNRDSVYWHEMGLKHVKDQEVNTIDIYTYGDSGLTVAVEYCGVDRKTKSKKPSDVFFAFDNAQSKLQMITDGSWELDVYPRPGVKWMPKDVLFRYFITYYDEILQADIVSIDDMMFTFIHKKTGELEDIENDLIFGLEYYPTPNRRRSIMDAYDDIGKKIAWFFKADKVFYQDNPTGDLVRNYLENALKR